MVTGNEVIGRVVKGLVIDGAGYVRKVVDGKPHGRGYSLILADNPKDGLKSAIEDDIDLILVDDDMPQMEGIEFVNILKGAETTKNIPVGIVTSSVEAKLREEGKKAGVADFLIKPFTLPELIGFIESLSRTDAATTGEKERIVVVEDSPILCKIYANILSRFGFEYQIISDSRRAIEGITSFQPHLVLMDQNMPDINGMELTRMLKGNEELVNIPIIMVTSDTKKKSILKALEYGVVDFLTKPFDEEVLLARMRAHLNNKKLFDSLSLAYKEMSELKNRLELLSITDGLTGLFNHRHFHDILREQMRLSKKNRSELSIILFDIDHFKKFNDVYGHKAGDKVIQVTAHVLQKSIRPQDISARYGGEEYAVILPNTAVGVAGEVAEKIRSDVEGSKAIFEDLSLSVTVSAGVALWDYECSEDKFVVCADMAMYESKKAGRNKVTIA
ncbi:hypothetical protein MNBD_NITROSPINAE02-1636 [hydrothermal vent metagenome]|uniref:Uncharacterized protein n=1 Tax=hydrothermal vent metagenome TaxID=652676 RepID=A0A3B1C156_9ZZZZ